MVENTGSRSPGELLITESTSDVAVCCPSASVRSSVRWCSSVSSRAFSIATTAWAAKSVISVICFSVNGRTSWRDRWNEPISWLSFNNGTARNAAVGLCNSYDAVILLREGEHLRIADHYGPMKIDFEQLRLGRDFVAGRTVVDGAPVHVHDLTAEGDEFPRGRQIALRLDQRTVLGLPLSPVRTPPTSTAAMIPGLRRSMYSRSAAKSAV